MQAAGIFRGLRPEREPLCRSQGPQQGVAQRRAWQRPNTYCSKIAAHAHRGQARRVRKRVNGAISAETDSGPWRRNYTIDAHVKRVKSHKFRMGEDGDVERLVHVLLGERSGRGVWELVKPDPGAPYPKTRVGECMK